MAQKECNICRKVLGSSQAYKIHLKSKKHIRTAANHEQENIRIQAVITKINNSPNDDWDDYLKTYIIKWNLPSKQFTSSFYRVLGNIINNTSDISEKEQSVKLIKNISVLYKKPIPEWINIPINNTLPISASHNNTLTNSQTPTINSIFDMELMTLSNQLSDIINIEREKAAMMLVNKEIAPTQEKVLNEIEKYVIFYHNKTILDLLKALETANLFIKHQLEYDLYSKYGSSASEEQVNELISIYKQKFPTLCKLVNNSI